jgi:amidase
MPASCCGLVGLKPTRGRVSPAPATPPPGDLSVEFALTRSVRDAAALLDAVSGSVPGDPYAIAPPSGSYLDGLADLPRLRIAFSTEHLWDRRTDPEVAASVERVARLCEELGHSVEERRPRFGWERYVRATLDVWGAMTAAGVRWAAAQTGLRPGPETLEGHTRSWDEHGRSVSAADLVEAVEVLGEVTRDVARFFDDVDVFLSPTIPTLPVRLGEYDPDAEVGVTWYYDSPVGNLESTTSLFNCTGQPAVSLPLGQSAHGLPIGVHLAGRFGAEATLLGLSAALEEAAPWRDRRPPIHAADNPSTTGVTR